MFVTKKINIRQSTVKNDERSTFLFVQLFLSNEKGNFLMRGPDVEYQESDEEEEYYQDYGDDDVFLDHFDAVGSGGLV